MNGYYKEKLSALRLQQCYDIASPRVRRYLDAEVNHVLGKITPGCRVLELGCGYGRILPRLAEKAGLVVGLDNSPSSLKMARERLSVFSNCRLLAANAVRPAFAQGVFDLTVCIQNGISAFHVDRQELIEQGIRITRPGGLALFSTYSPKFWQHRLEWFYRQAEAGLLGEIDEERTGNGVIVCKDGFTADTVSPGEFRRLTAGFAVDIRIVEVDKSSLFCEIYC